MNYQRKTLFRIACIIGIAVLAVSVKMLFFKGSQPVKNAATERKAVAAADVPGTENKSAGRPAVISEHDHMPAEQRTTGEIAHEAAEREEEDPEEDPETLEKKAVLEKQIQELTQEKEKGQQELNKLLAAVADAQKKSELNAGDKQGKEYEVLFLKLYMIRVFNEKLASIDSSLKEKLTEYTAVIKKPDEPLEQFPEE
jgi:hypothetical protein